MAMQKRIPFVLVTAAMGLGSIALTAGRLATSGDSETVRATAAPTFGTPIAKTSRVEILSYARQLQYDTVAGVSDRRRLSNGVLASIQPEVGSYLNTESSLASGRIMARIVIEDVSASVANLKQGDTLYWWADKEDGRWTSRYIPTNGSAPIVVRGLQIERHHDFQWKQAVARWKWFDGGEETWVSCITNGCCQPPQRPTFP